MKRKSLFSILKEADIKHNLKEDIFISDLADDSRKITKNSIFLAPNASLDKLKVFVSDAIKNGAAVIIAPVQIDIKDIPTIRVEDDKIAKMRLAKAFFPKQPENIYTVTGSNGKTSTVHFIRQMLYFAGRKAVSIGTLGIGYDENVYDLSKDNVSLTTPGAIDLHKTLDNLSLDYPYAAIEASSHGLDQHRLDMLNVKAVGFTNFTQDHLDYHSSMENYFAAKMRIFNLPKAGSIAAVNSDIPEFSNIKEKIKEKNLRLVDFGYKANCIKIISCKLNIEGMDVVIEYFGKKVSFFLKLAGEFQLYNVIASMAMLADDITNPLDFITKLSPVPGRMQKAKSSKNIYIDYAHTPDALEKAIKVLREHNPKRIITVFGCGGDRDSLKRPIMGDIAANLSDVTIITDDNPRTEDPNLIRRQIIANHNNFIEIADRKQAILEAINMAASDDIVLIAGKGHEKYQIIGETKFDFDDVKVAEGI